MKTNPNHRNDSSARAAEPRLGVDIGRVLIAGDGTDTPFIGTSDENALRAPAVPGAFEAIARLRAALAGRVWLVSKCGAGVEARTRKWLAHHRFFDATGLEPAQVLFCRTRPEKAPICARLGITCFVDDRADILASMAGIVAHRVLFGARESSIPGAVPAADWIEAEVAIVRLLNLDGGATPDTSPARAP